MEFAARLDMFVAMSEACVAPSEVPNRMTLADIFMSRYSGIN
jgi:hypothetical protein